MARGRKKVSSAWPHFVETGSKFQCKHCAALVVGPGCSNLKKHLQAKHKDIFDLVDRVDRSCGENGLTHIGTPLGSRLNEADLAGLDFPPDHACPSMPAHAADDELVRHPPHASILDIFKENTLSENNIGEIASSLLVAELSQQSATLAETVGELGRLVRDLQRGHTQLQVRNLALEERVRVLEARLQVKSEAAD